MNKYLMLTKDTDGEVLSRAYVESRSLDVAATAMRAALRADRRAARTELWLDEKRVSVIVRRRKRLVMTEDEPRMPAAGMAEA